MSRAKLKKIAKITFEVLAGAVLVTLFAVFIMTKLAGKPLFVGNKTTMWVMTQSMAPTISPKTYILVEKVTAAEVQVGDIVVFESTDPRIAGQYNTHRVIEIKENGEFVTKGDNNPGDDGKYSAQADKIMGRYVKTLPVMTFLGRVMMSTAGFAVIMVVFVLTTVLCVLPDLKNVFKQKDAEEEEEKKREMERRVQEEMARIESEGKSLDELREELQSTRKEDTPPKGE